VADKIAKRKSMTIILVSMAVVTIAGIAVGVTLLVSAKHSSVSKKQVLSTTTASTSQYKLAACTSGATQTIDNASYVVGTDFAAGSYKIVSQTGDIGWTNINVYNSKAEYVKQGSPSIEQGVADQSFEPDNGITTYTKLTDGQFMQIDSDPATFTCE
jgi:hypothetical protein